MKIVVARYKENVEWTRLFQNVVIYNKGFKLVENFNEVMLDNVGKEGHSYYKYICDNYDKLEDYIVFLQGNPFDHSPNIIRNLKTYLYLLKHKKITLHFKILSEHILDCNLSGCPHHKKNKLPLIDIYEKLFKIKETNMNFKFGAGAQFIVSKESILKRPLSFYLNIVQMLEGSINPIEGFVIERFHGLIFR